MNNTPFLSIKDAATATGLSQKFLRLGVRRGEIPHICAGTKYMINLPALMEQLNAKSVEAVRRGEL